ncbi:UNVERIFIED_CONTAM: hypothetical protein NCL1_54388 [Trichonephila clavipes]
MSCLQKYEKQENRKYRIAIQNNHVYKISVRLNALKREEKKSFKVLIQVAKNETNVTVSP